MKSLHIAVAALAVLSSFQVGSAAGEAKAGTWPVTFTGGYEADPQDHGRPVTLIAAALGVTPEVFREAFSRVTPARGGERPKSEQVQANKKALMEALGPHGITNERLDEVSNFYRYNRAGGEQLWKHTAAEAVAVVNNGKVTGFKIINPGAGYTTPPTVAVEGLPTLEAKATLHFDKDLKRNGSIEALEIVK